MSFEFIRVKVSNYNSVPSENCLVSNTVLCGTNTVWQHHSSDAVVVGVETSMMVSRALRRSDSNTLNWLMVMITRHVSRLSSPPLLLLETLLFMMLQSTFPLANYSKLKSSPFLFR